MFLIDDLLLAPAKALLFIFKEIHKRALEEYSGKERVINEMRRLQYLLDAGEISEDEYNRREEELIRHLENIEPEKTTVPEDKYEGQE